MGKILDDFIKQYEEDKKNEDYNLPGAENMEQGSYDEESMEKYKEKLDKMRRADDELIKQYKEFQESFENVSEKELFEKDLTQTDYITAKIRRAYCPNCKTEIISKMPSMFNPYTLEKIARYECPNCGKKYNLEYSYPRFVIVGPDGNEIKCFFE